MKPRFMICLVGVSLFLNGCVSVPVTPKALETAAKTNFDAQQALRSWENAIVLANLFLTSRFRETLPTGTLAMSADGMVFSHGAEKIPILIRSTTFGDLLVKSNYAAQERSWGFVVGRIRDGGDRLTSNSFFRLPSGVRQGNVHMAGLILHELTHMYLKHGVDHPVNFVRYYGEAILLLRYKRHTMERQPFKTTDEYYAFIESFSKEHPEMFSPAGSEQPDPPHPVLVPLRP